MCIKIYTVLSGISLISHSIALQNNLSVTVIFRSFLVNMGYRITTLKGSCRYQTDQTSERFVMIKILFEIACAATGFAMSLLFAKQLDLGTVPAVFMGLMGAIFTFILAQGFTSFIFRILRRD